jgi:hypothetical protein
MAEIKKYRLLCDSREEKKGYEFYGYHYTSGTNYSVIVEISPGLDGKDVPVERYSDEDVVCIQDFDDRNRKDPKISELRIVELWFKDGSPQKHIVHQDDVDKFVEATLKLHFKPGINPHVTDGDNKTSRVSQIWVFPIVNQGGYWWSDPELKSNTGAHIYDSGLGKIAWIDPSRQKLA